MFRNKFFFKEVNSMLIRLPAPINISYFWNFSSCLSLLLTIQILTGVFLSMFYISFSDMTFKKINYLMMDNNFSWSLRLLHTVGASMLMLLLYFHLMRGLYYKRYANSKAWNFSIILMILMMSAAFLSYVLPWSQMSFWGATVITNLITTVPFISESIVKWLWSSFSVSSYTLNRFFSFHFLLPMLIIIFSLIHLLMIHERGAGNILSTPSNLKLDFWPFFSYKDLFGFFILFFAFLIMLMYYPYSLMDPENFMKANPSITPLHIKPEWYFLFAYAMLRSIPNKTASVLVLVFSILVFFLFPLSNIKKMNYTFLYKFFFFMWVFNFLLLTWLSSCPVKSVYNMFSQVAGIFYFFFIFFLIYL